MQNYVVEVDGYFVVWIWGSINQIFVFIPTRSKKFLTADQKHDLPCSPFQTQGLGALCVAPDREATTLAAKEPNNCFLETSLFHGCFALSVF